MNKNRTAFALIALSVGLLTMAGCATKAPAQADEPADDGTSVTLIDDRPSEVQSDALADGKVGRDEYLGGFAAYESCLNEAGFELTAIDLEATILDYAVPDEAVQAGVEEPCYRRHFALIDETWQLANVDSTETTQFLRACLEANGIEPSKDSTKLEQQVREELKISPANCTTE